MSPSTPLYSIPYLTGSSQAREIATVSEQSAARLEALLKARTVAPLSSDLASLVTRINSIESVVAELAGLKGRALPAAIRATPFNTVSDNNGRFTVTHGGTSAPSVVLVSERTQSNDMLSRINRCVVDSMSASSVTLRLVRTDESNWLPGNPAVGFLMSVWI